MDEVMDGERFWSGGYFYESVCRVTNEAIQFYITRCQGKHWTKQTQPIPGSQ